MKNRSCKSRACRCSSPAHSANYAGLSFDAPRNCKEILELAKHLLANPVFAYIVTSIKTNSIYELTQTGCGPNFDGGRITLCTCKHQARATYRWSKDRLNGSDPEDPWKNVWVAGLTSNSENPSRSLAYLMCVEKSFKSHNEIWNYPSIGEKCRQAKSASKSILGDFYVPKKAASKNPYDPKNYECPISGHEHSPDKKRNDWYTDIEEYKKGCPHHLLLGQKEQSYRWPQVRMILKNGTIGHSAHHKKYETLEEFLGVLQDFSK